MLRRERLVPLSEAVESEGWPLAMCNWCDDRPRKSVVALELKTRRIHRYYGACGYHAEVLPVKLGQWSESQ